MLSKSSLIALVALGCGASSPGPATVPASALDAESPPSTEATEATEANNSPTESTESVEPATASGTASKECIPTGVYKVEIDLSPAKYEVSGGTMSLDFCKAQLAAVVPGYFGEMAIRHQDGAVEVAWPSPRKTVANGCEIEIPEAKGVTRFTFADEKAEGIAAFIMTVPNHNETCAATGATIRLTLAERH